MQIKSRALFRRALAFSSSVRPSAAGPFGARLINEFRGDCGPTGRAAGDA